MHSVETKRTLNKKKTTTKLLKVRDNLKANKMKEEHTNFPSTNRDASGLDLDSSPGTTGDRIGTGRQTSHRGNSSQITTSKEV